MATVRLEIDEVMIHRPKKRWNLYFIVVADHPDDDEKMMVTMHPQEPFRLSKKHNNEYMFDTPTMGSEGLLVLKREMPVSRELNVHFYLRHTNKPVRNFGQMLRDIESGMVGETFGIVSEIIGTAAAPWLVISKKAVPLIGSILSRIPDRDFGFLSAFERFGPEFEMQTEIDRIKDFTGDASLVYSWSLDPSETKSEDVIA